MTKMMEPAISKAENAKIINFRRYSFFFFQIQFIWLFFILFLVSPETQVRPETKKKKKKSAKYTDFIDVLLMVYNRAKRKSFIASKNLTIESSYKWSI